MSIVTSKLGRFLHSSAGTIALGLLLLSPYLAYLLLYPYYVSGPDEAWQIQGTQELLRGNGYLSALHAPYLDLSDHRYFYLHSWPIGYSGTVFLLAKFGLPLEWAVKAFHFICISLGVSLWALLAQRYLPLTRFRVLFLALLVPQLISWGVYPSVLASWALVPAFAILLLGYPERKRTLPLGICLSALLILRYQNIIFVPAAVAYLAWCFRKEMPRLLKEVTLVSFLPALVFLMIFLMNHLNAGMANPVRDAYGFHWNWDWVPGYLSTFLFSSSYRVDDLFRALSARASLPAYGEFVIRATAVFWGAWTIWELLKLRRSPEREGQKRIALIFVAIFASTAALLMAMALLFNAGTLYNGRYHHFLFPVLLFLLVGFLAARLEERAAKCVSTVVGFLVFFSFFATVKFAQHRKELSHDFSRKMESVLRIMDDARRSDPEAPAFVVADHMFPMFALNRYLHAGMTTAELDGEKTHFSRPTWLFLVTDHAPMKPQYTSLENVNDWAQRLLLEEYRDGPISLYGRKFQAGTLRSQAK